MSNPKTHPFIVIEGIDKTGKSTIASLIAKKKDYLLYEYPNRTTPIGKIIDTFLKKEEYNHFLFNNQENEIVKMSEIENNIKKLPKNCLDGKVANLLFSANRYESAKSIEQRNQGIITARYKYSGFAGGLVNNLPKEWVESMDKLLPKPTHLFFIDSNFEEVKHRGNKMKLEIYEEENKAKVFYKHLKDVCIRENAIILEGGKDLNFYVDEIIKIIENK